MSTDGMQGVNVYGETDPQTRIMKLNISDKVFNSGYRRNNNIISSKEITPARKKTGLRVLKEIIEEIDSNYYLNLDGAGKTLTEHEVYGRMKLNEYNTVSRIENFKEIRKKLREGLVNGVKVIPTINRASQKVTLTATTTTQPKEFSATITIRPLPPVPPIDPEIPI
jgi:tRNA/tmRNA/rRNA uracil-C5-methylase (TrmA/RlmC/RlmD family)